MRILLFGRTGQVGRCFAKAAAAHELTALGRSDADLIRKGDAAAAIAAHKPDMIVNAAAYTAVDKAEAEQAEAIQLNAIAPAEMAAAATQSGAGFIHVSTDYVFDGGAEAHYREDDVVAPLNIYGRSKHEGEMAVLAANPEAVVLRTSWVFSAHGNNFVKTMLRLGKNRDTLSVVSDQIGGPTAAADIAAAIMTIAGKKHRSAPGVGLYHFQGRPAVSWAGFAEEIFRAADLSVAVDPILTKNYPTDARRPLRTVLDCARIERDFGIGQPDWRPALKQVIETLNKSSGINHPDR